MSLYHEWGFVDSPFQPQALPADELGERLLVGRDRELRLLKRRMNNASKITTVEGSNGIGKTSLVNVAAFQSFRDYLLDDAEFATPLLIPCKRPFQIRPDQSVADFVDEVLMEVAQTLLERADAVSDGLEAARRGPQLNKWLNSPQLSAWQGGIGVVSAGRSTETNTGAGYTRSGFRKAVLEWLAELFPTPSRGGVVCVIDNLELLETSSVARRQLEALRDELLTVPGFRWILCGALGIVLGVVSSPRLEGLLHSPIEIEGIERKAIREVLRARQRAFERATGSSYLPITEKDFERLYVLLAENLRSTLGLADEYCHWIDEQSGRTPSDKSEKEHCFHLWLFDRAEKYRAAAERTIKPKAWEVFGLALTEGGRFSPSDFKRFGFNTPQTLRPHVKDLEDAGLLSSSRDDSDQRRKTIEVTTRGYLVDFSRKHLSKK